jgi:hypothetical protein
MRIVAAFLTLGSLLPGAANAGSIIALAPAEQLDHPSIVVPGASAASPSTKAAAAREPASGSSVIALGSANDDKVSAIAGESQRPLHRPTDIPMVIRGGIVGDAFARTASAASSPAMLPGKAADASPADQPQPQTSAPSPEGKSADGE